MPQVPKARDRRSIEEPVCEDDVCGMCHVQGGRGDMFDMVRWFDRGAAVSLNVCGGGPKVIFPSAPCSSNVRSVRMAVIKIVIDGIIWNVRWSSFQCLRLCGGDSWRGSRMVRKGGEWVRGVWRDIPVRLDVVIFAGLLLVRGAEIRMGCQMGGREVVRAEWVGQEIILV